MDPSSTEPLDLCGVSFDESYRNVLETREELELLLPAALDLAGNRDELLRLSMTVNKMLQSCGTIRREILSRIVQIDHNSRDAPSRLPSTMVPTTRSSPVTVHSASNFTQPPSAAAVPVQSAPSVPLGTARSTMSSVPAPASSRSSSVTHAKSPMSAPDQAGQCNGETALNGSTGAYSDVLDLGKIKPLPVNGLSEEMLDGLPIMRVWFPFLNPATTPESLQAGLRALGYVVKNMELYRWQNNKFRGCGWVELNRAHHIWELIGRSDVVIDGWIVTPKLRIEEMEIPHVNGIGPEDIQETLDLTPRDIFGRDLSDPEDLEAYQCLQLFMLNNWLPVTHPQDSYTQRRAKELPFESDEAGLNHSE
ncbi:uncharacterized protein LOC129585356 [Paramacrobiotus metropolitanus]|uniref:uncharacterized protein LOC129585356 n=1 Tax=Paramacrobiotus metropolitanus TaxID=2943436 RepID=UPI002445FF93|nr:uncharacterized protein LOC129585356 [Paramacrobiotus metropolitanus]